MRVPLLDLKPQYQALKKEIDAVVSEVIESQYFIMGPKVDKMEQEFCEYLGAKYSLGVSSGTDALLLALMAIGIKPGDEIIMPTYSFFATIGVVARLNAVPVLVDSDPVTFNIDPALIEAKITPKTKAIIPVHLFGQSCDMVKIMEIADRHNLYVIEDGAQAISVQYKDGKAVGNIGHIGCFSFFPSKNLGCFGDGGLVTTNDEKLFYNLKIMRNHGMDPKYYHKTIGGNFRLDALQAAVLSVKLPHLDSWSAGRRYNAEFYSNGFIKNGVAEETGKTVFDANNKILLPKAVYGESGHKNHHIFNQYIIRVEDRDGLRDFLTKNEIFTEIYYPVPFHLQECFAYLGYKKGDFPVAEEAAEKSIALPIYPELSDEQKSFVVEKITEYLKK